MTARPTRITQWQQRALDNGRTPLLEAPGLRPWLREQLSDGAAPPARAVLRPLAPAPAPAQDTATVTPKSTQLSSTTTEGSAEPSSQTPSSSPPDEKSQSQKKEKKDSK
ncbi:Ff.00g112070.m01.CDS01 [Fusarium sp. VM40]|nr:Ff.00g112070.m01.CDS01 [Fusarium sp. VM40]